MKGIILAGGSGTRLHPLTISVSKQLLPVYSSPMIYYPLTTLINAGVVEVLIITTPHDNETGVFKRLLGDGSEFGIKISYEVQHEPNGIANALIIGEKFLNGDSCILILGDNIFHGDAFVDMLDKNFNCMLDCNNRYAIILGCKVHNPSAYGVFEVHDAVSQSDWSFLPSMSFSSIVEKPKVTNNRMYAIPGIYWFPGDAPGIVKDLPYSARNEREITELIDSYRSKGRLFANKCKDLTWFDAGTCDSLLEASQYVQAVEARTGIKVACPHEAALNKGLITSVQFNEIVKGFRKSQYGMYLADKNN